MILVDGVPSHLEPHLTLWINTYAQEYAARVICLSLQISPSGRINNFIDLILDYAYSDEQQFLEIIDAILHHDSFARWQGGNELKAILKNGGSRWTVSEQFEKLILRVSDETRTSAERIMGSVTPAGDHFRNAWLAFFGRTSDISKSYSQCIKALETLLIPIVSPNNTLATLGTVIGEIRGGTKFIKNGFPATYQLEAKEMLLSTLQLIWKNQADRHGTASGAISIDETIAQFCVISTLAILTWFENGTFDKSLETIS